MPRKIQHDHPQVIEESLNCELCGSRAELNQEICTTALIQLWAERGVSVEAIFKNIKFFGMYKCQRCLFGFYFPKVCGDDKFYAAMAEQDWYYRHEDKIEYRYAADWLNDCGNVVDVGCGIGEFSQYLPPHINFLGLEVSTEAVKIAKSLGRNVKQLEPQGNFTANGQFDAVTCFQVLEHVSDIPVFLKFLVDLCKPAGRIIIAVPNNESFLSVAVNNVLNMPPHHVSLWNKTSLFVLAERNACEVENYIEEKISAIHIHSYYMALIYAKTRKLFRLRHKVIEVRPHYYFFQKIVGRLAKVCCLLAPSPNVPGHSSIIILRKSGDS